jgi:GNAT superfamily N-acetyltransferase
MPMLIPTRILPDEGSLEWCFTERPGLEFAALTFPRFRRLLAADQENVTAIGVFVPSSAGNATGDMGIPVGLALLGKPPQPQAQMRLLSLMLHSRYRGKGLAAELMARAESAARSQGAASLVASYASRLPRRQEFECLLGRCGWSRPEVCEMRTAGHAAVVAAEMDRLEASHRPYLPPGATIEAWASVAESERGEVDALAAEIGFNAFLAPSLHEPTAHPELSLVLRREGKIAGWVFGVRESDAFCHYGCGYVVPALRRRGALIALIREVCRKQAALFGPQSVAQLSTTPATPGMPRFIRERLAACALWYDELLTVSKDLTV